MANINLDYYKGEDLYSDGDVEDDILNIVQGKISLLEMSRDEINYAIAYHLSELRENILNWYNFKEKASVLEIGSGCGALTGLLCNKCKDVVSVELSKRRATINFERNKGYDNLSIIVGNLNDILLESQYDYIVLNGVFEYAMSFTDDNDPYIAFLNNIKKYLKKEGRILIAIENRLGLKYFSGSSEDHIKSHFSGIDGYVGVSTVRTFSKSELVDLLNRAGLKYHKFYYPYPDYKFPKEIFTDETINTMSYGRNMPQYEEDRVYFFDSSRVFKTLANENVNSVFANSFLVEASMDEIVDEKRIIYAKISSDRKPEFRIKTTIFKDNYENKYVEKDALNITSQLHIEQLQKNGSIKRKEYYNLQCEKGSQQGLIYEYLEGANLDEVVLEYLEKHDMVSVKKILKQIYYAFFADTQYLNDVYSDDFCKVFGKTDGCCGYDCINPANIDIILDNLYIKNNKYCVIDCEWIFDFPVPVKFIMWRLINEFFAKHNIISGNMYKNDLMEYFDIDKNDNMVFNAWGNHFAVKYVGTDILKNSYRDAININIEEILRKIKSLNQMYTKVYINTGEGYSEGNTIDKTVEIDSVTHEFVVKYDLRNISNLVSLRWDPAITPCLCEDIHFAVNGRKFDYTCNASLNQENKDYFYNNESLYECFFAEFQPMELEVSGKFFYLDSNDSIDKLEMLYRQSLEKLNREKKCLEEEKTQINNELFEKINKLNEVEMLLKQTMEKKNETIFKYNQVVNSRIWKSTKWIRSILDRKKKY